MPKFWVVQSAQEVSDKLARLKNRQITHIDTYDFKNMYDNFNLGKLIESLKHVANRLLSAASDNYAGGSEALLYVTLHGHSTVRWASSNSAGYKSAKRVGSEMMDDNGVYLDEEDIGRWASILVNNTYIQKGDVIFRQKKGIPMGTNCAPQMANLMCHDIEHSFLSNQEALGNLHHMRDSVFMRFIDDLLVMNCPMFEKWVNEHTLYGDLQLDLSTPACVYDDDAPPPPGTTVGKCVNYLDMTVSVGSDGTIQSKLFDKRRSFPFPVHTMTDLASLVPLSVVHGVLIGRVLRMYQVHSDEGNFIEDVSDFVQRMLVQNHWIPTLTFRKLRVFFERHYEKKESWTLSKNEMFDRIRDACIPN